MSAAPTAPLPATATEQLVAFVCDAAPAPTPATVAALRGLVVDTVAVATAGTRTPAADLLRSWVTEQYPARTADSTGLAAVWGTGTRLGPADAALVNGTAAHALDWDDAAPSMAMHPAAVLLPTLFALSARRPVTGAELVAAYDVGSAVFRAVSEILPHHVHYGRGWHNTSTTGRLAATAAAGRLLGLDRTATRHALGIAASCAAGSLANFGTMTKPMHAGLAARDAVTAVGLAARGFTANPGQLDARGGFLELFGEPSADRTARLGERLEHWRVAWVEDYAIKAYPSCFATQRAIDAGISLREELGADLGAHGDAVARIEVTLEHRGTRPLRDAPASTGLEAKFSLEYCLAVALVHGDVVLGDFTDAALGRPGLATLAAKVELGERPAADEPGHTVVRLHLTDGRTLERIVHHSRGDSHRPLTTDELAAKFGQCVGDGAPQRAWFEALHGVPDRTTASDLQELLAGPEAS
ncbi:MmgE/PrpD family protein [Nocardioides sp. zg-536]|uniref:MmgE/PrpD family protein n=1 Tax=Nocardioides faecalis TaxID=2803858 RepID=A0A939BWM6_9ACTN|nr:MmgE/PrpD family protein [Nocardioides faecalis]MBM9461201.1 MmgE/PrpD family protein [Nocardioides faecalis]QVI59049.1 MmgE/PrpD family protein [Nocardioides faecalis]